MPLKRLVLTLTPPLLAIAVFFMMMPCAGAQTYKILHAFTGGTDGGGVYGGVVMDKQGNLYGVTSGGGAFGYGTVFELSPNADGTWTEAVLHSFQDDANGAEPMGTLLLDAAGNLYGTTANAGAYKGGTAFELSASSGGGAFTLLYSFAAYPGDADFPNGNLIMDAAGNLYGTSRTGGTNQTTGTIFELSPGTTGWTETLLYSFPQTGNNGFFPLTGLAMDLTGDLYGTTYWGGDLSCGAGAGCGVAYKLRPSSSNWKENVLHDFGSFARDGVSPSSPLSFDAAGNLYGTVKFGGIHRCGTGAGCGVLFKLTPNSNGSPWKESTIFQFRGGKGGQNPQGGLLFDKGGSIYGADGAGGAGIDCGCGVIYQLAPAANGQWIYKVLHSFDGTDGALPNGSLVSDSNGNLYGTTITSGSGGAGVVFEITP